MLVISGEGKKDKTHGQDSMWREFNCPMLFLEGKVI